MPSRPSSLPEPLFLLAVLDLVFSLLLLLVVPLRCPCGQRSHYRYPCVFLVPFVGFPLVGCWVNLCKLFPRKILGLLRYAWVYLGLLGLLELIRLHGV